MAEILDLIKDLRDRTGAGFVDCKNALIESKNDIDSAINLVNTIYEHYDSETASELERRLLNSIRGQDNKKFIRSIRKADDHEA